MSKKSRTSTNGRRNANEPARMFAMTEREFHLVIAGLLLGVTKSLPVRELVSKLVLQMTGREIVPPEAGRKPKKDDLIVHAELAPETV